MSAFTVVQPEIHTRPLVCATTWQTVMSAAGYRCQCTGSCGSQHSRTGGRCDRAHDQSGERLAAAPADLTLRPIDAARLPVSDLLAWCTGCRSKTARRQRAADANRARMDAPTDTLF